MATFRIYSAELMGPLEMTREQVDTYATQLQAALESEWPGLIEVEVIDRTTGAGSGLTGADDLPTWRDEERVDAISRATLERITSGVAA